MSNSSPDNTVIFNTPDAVVKNTSRQKFIFLNANVKGGGSGAYTKTYKLERGKEVCIHPSDYILMRPEIERYVSEGKILIVRDIDMEIRSEVRRQPNLKRHTPHDPFCFGPGITLEDSYKAVQRLASRTADPVAPDNDTFWIIDKGTGNTPITDIDVRFRIADQTYSVFDSAIGSIITATKGLKFTFTVLDWVLVGDYYELTFNHGLNSDCIDSTIYEGNKRVWVDLETATNNNDYTIRVTSDPDLRFAGSICLIKIT